MFLKKIGLESFLINRNRNNNSNFRIEFLIYFLSTEYLLQVAGYRVQSEDTLYLASCTMHL